jgi:hypothetical protein
MEYEESDWIVRSSDGDRTAGASLGGAPAITCYSFPWI